MKLTFLGTAAAEGFPALFCNCEYCIEARKRGGKNFRTRSQSLVNGDLLIDFPCDTLSHLHNNRIRGDLVEYLLITHSHGDHIYPNDLRTHGSYYAHNMEKQTLNIFCGETVYARLDGTISNIRSEIKDTLSLNKIEKYEPVTFGNYEVTALPARHAPGEVAFFYIIKEIDSGKTLLYAHDTGYFYDEVLDYIKDNGIRFDCASFDCTNAHLPSKETGSHMGFDMVGKLIGVLRSFGAVDDGTKLFVNHFSHNGNPLHEEMELSASKIGCEVSYDGRTVEF